MVEPTPLSPHALSELLETLNATEQERYISVVRLQLDDGATLDVFRSECVRQLPLTWKLRCAVGDVRPVELTALALATVDGRVFLTTSTSSTTAPTMGGRLIVGAGPHHRAVADLAELIAQRLRRTVDPS